MAVAMVLKKTCTRESHTRVMRLQQELIPKSAGGRGVKYSIILFPTFLLHEDFLKKGKHEKIVSKICVLFKNNDTI